jgi:hypothetical protein
MVVVTKAIYMFNPILIKISITFFTEIEKSIVKIIWKHKRALIATKILSKGSKSRGITLHDFKLYYQDIIMKTTLYW